MHNTQLELEAQHSLISTEVEQYNHMLNNVLKLSAQLTAILEPQHLITELVQQSITLTPAFNASLLWLFDRQHNHFMLAAHTGLPQPTQADKLLPIRLRPGEGLPGAIFQHNDTRLLDYRTYCELGGRVHLRSEKEMRAYLQQFPRHMQALVFPLKIGNDIIGALELITTSALHFIRPQEIQILHTFANIAAAALHHAQEHLQMLAYQRRLGALSAIGTVVSTAADLEELVANVLDVLLNVVGVSSGILLLYDPVNNTLTVGASRELPNAYIELQQGIAVAQTEYEEALRYGQLVRRPLLDEGAEEILITKGLKSCTYIPLLVGGTVVGVVSMFGDSNLLDRLDVSALMTMGNLIGFAIANVRLYQESQNERRKLSVIINSIAEGVILCDRQGWVVLANRHARDLVGMHRISDHISESGLADILNLRDLQGHPLPQDQFPIMRALTGEILHDYRIMISSNNGQDFVLSFTAAPVYDDSNMVDGAVAIFRDVTEQQRLERAKDDFLAVAAHELRSPLAAVYGYTDLLLRYEKRMAGPDQQKMRGLTLLTQQVSHMMRLVDSLLDVSRLDAGQFSLLLQSSDLVQITEHAIDQLRPVAQSRQLVFEHMLPEIELHCDPLRIQQILTNLIGNAIRYSPNHTTIEIRLSVEQHEWLAASHSTFADYCTQYRTLSMLPPAETFAVVSVTDQGGGITTTQIERLFRRYERGESRAGEGLGLGLYLSKAFASRHEGTIWVESEVGLGSTFYVALPMCPVAKDVLQAE